MSRLVSYQKIANVIKLAFFTPNKCHVFLNHVAKMKSFFFKLLYGTNYFYGFFLQSHTDEDHYLWESISKENLLNMEEHLKWLTPAHSKCYDWCFRYTNIMGFLVENEN